MIGVSMLRTVVFMMAGTAHHAQHFRTASAQKANYRNCSKQQKDDVESCCVVPVNRFFHDLNAALLRNQMECSEKEFYCQSCQT
jgi:hypothetical protein